MRSGAHVGHKCSGCSGSCHRVAFRPFRMLWHLADNLKPHQAAEARRAVEGTGAILRALPPYSPDLTPIEEMWSKVKGGLRSAAARTTEAVYDAMGAALRAVCPEDILGWFKSCGLCATQG